MNNQRFRVHGHANGLKTILLFSLMWAVIFIIWFLTGARQSTLAYYVVIAVVVTMGSYWFSDRIATAAMGAREVSEDESPNLYAIVRELSQKSGA